jgi:hypothetical protein
VNTRRFFRWLGDALDPTVMMRRYTVHCLDWNGGRFRCFWFRSSAEWYAERVPSGWLFIDIEDDLTGRSIRVRNNPDKIAPPVRYINLTPEREPSAIVQRITIVSSQSLGDWP